LRDENVSATTDKQEVDSNSETVIQPFIPGKKIEKRDFDEHVRFSLLRR